MTFGLPNKQINTLNSIFSNYDAVEEVNIYGSRAIGKHRVGSDIAITLKGTIAFNTLLHLEAELDNQMLPYSLDVSIFKNLKHQALITHINKFGKLLYKKPLNSVNL